MSATEKEYQSCLPPEAYIRICRNVNDGVYPKFRSSVYPKTYSEVTKKTIKKQSGNMK